MTHNNSNDDNWLNLIKSVKPLSSKKIVAKTKNTKVKIFPLKETSEVRFSKTILDFHGNTQDQAFLLLEDFLINAQKANNREVLIITGKGKKEGSGVFKELLPRWLELTSIKKYVREYEVAPAHRGGSGAYVVKIKKI